MGQFGTGNFNAYARKILIDGYVIHLDLSEFQKLSGEINAIGINITQPRRHSIGKEAIATYHKAKQTATSGNVKKNGYSLMGSRFYFEMDKHC